MPSLQDSSSSQFWVLSAFCVPMLLKPGTFLCGIWTLDTFPLKGPIKLMILFPMALLVSLPPSI